MADIIEELSAKELIVLMEMTDEVAYKASYLAEDLNYQDAEAKWTERRVNAVQRALKDKGFTALIYLVNEDGNNLAGRGYVLTRKGCMVRFRKLAQSRD